MSNDYTWKGKRYSKTRYYQLRLEENERLERAQLEKYKQDLERMEAVHELQKLISGTPAEGTSEMHQSSERDSPFSPTPLPSSDVNELDEDLLSVDLGSSAPTSIEDHEVEENVFDARLYMGPSTSVTDSDTVPKEVRDFLKELHGIFVHYNIPLRGQGALLKLMKNMTPEMQQYLPVDGRTLRPRQISHLMRSMSPGQFLYIGIATVLSYPGVRLFNEDRNEVNLSVGIDGTPYAKSGRGAGFWPIIGSVGKYRPFLIAAYEGPDKPKCANDFLKEFTEECKNLTENGLVINGHAYKFRLYVIIMDSIGAAFILGCKYPTGYDACRQCTVCGEYLIWGGDEPSNSRTQSSCIHNDLTGAARRMRRSQKKGRGVRLLDLDAPARTHDDYVKYAAGHQFCEHEKLKLIATEYPESEGTVSAEDSQQRTDSFVVGDRSSGRKLNEDTDAPKGKDRGFHTHPTCLVNIPCFDIVRGTPYDYMHLICEGVVAYLLDKMKLPGSAHKFCDTHLSLLDERMHELRNYCPSEFQRLPDPFTKNGTWKATQYRQYLLYNGTVVFHEVLEETYLQHFHLLVSAIRLLARRTDMTTAIGRQKITIRAEKAELLLREFWLKTKELYGPQVAGVFNFHNVIHLINDYRHFGCIDNFSAFTYESYLGYAVKRHINGYCNPLVQLLNAFTSILYTQQYTQLESGEWSDLDEYFEKPECVGEIVHTEDFNTITFDISNIPLTNCTHFESFKRLRYKNFQLCIDNLRDSFCVMNSEKFVQLRKILHDPRTGDIFLVGNPFMVVRPRFEIDLPMIKITSMVVGIAVCSQPGKLQAFLFSEMRAKCFGMPLKLEKAGQQSDTAGEEWVLVQYLH